MQYLLELQLYKSVDAWDNENGAKGEHRDIDAWHGSIKTSDLPTKDTIQRLLESSGWGMTFAEFDLYEPGRYSLAVLENDDGYRDDNGNWLADYEIRIGVYTLEWVKDFSPL
jgi:hypothetical protein